MTVSPLGPELSSTHHVSHNSELDLLDDMQSPPAYNTTFGISKSTPSSRNASLFAPEEDFGARLEAKEGPESAISTPSQSAVSPQSDSARTAGGEYKDTLFLPIPNSHILTSTTE